MANIPNPRKIFNFSVSIPGLDPFLCQEFDVPDQDIDVVEHGDTNHLVPTGGLMKYSSAKMKKLSPATAPDNWIWDWMFQIQNVFTGGGDLPSNYTRTITVEQYSNDGVTVINTWVLLGAWPNKVNGSTFKRKDSENTMEDIEFKLEKMDHY